LQTAICKRPYLLIVSRLTSRFELWLLDSGIGVSVKQFPAGTRTAIDAARAVGCDVGQIVKSLVFMAAGRPVVALVSGVNRLDVRLTIRTDDDDLYPRDIRRCPPIQQQRARGQPGQGATSKPTTATSLPCRRLRQRLRNAHGSMPSQVVGKMIALSREAAFRPLFL